jgi:acyl dehydratase
VTDRTTSRRVARGPYFEELGRGQVFSAPSVTLTCGLAAAHQAIVGNRLRIALDHRLARDTGGGEPLAAPGLVWDLAIGQSTTATQNVRANLFYRGLVFSRFPRLGDTLTTTTTVEGLRQNRRREGRPATGLAALRIRTADQDGATVLDFWRCAMIPLGADAADTGHADDLDAVGEQAGDTALAAALQGFRLDRVPGAGGFGALRTGDTWEVAGGDVVSGAPELARLTLNLAAVHHDARAAGGRRLVYGGHTIGLALAQLTRALPDLVTVVGWHSCDHLGPVHEGDVLRSVVAVERLQALDTGGLAHLRVRVEADGDGRDRPVLAWRPVVALA